MGENGIAWATIYLAVVCGLGVIVPVDKDATVNELLSLASLSDAEAILYSSACASKVRHLENSLARICFSELGALVEEGEALLLAGDQRYPDAEINPDAMSVLLFTSGTTEDAKGVMLSHRNLCFNLSEMCRMFYIDERDVFLSVLPLHHAFECTCGFLCPLSRGATVVFAGGARHLLQDLRRASPSILLCVPVLLEALYHRITSTLQRNRLQGTVDTARRMIEALPSEKLRIAARKKLFAELHKSLGGNLRAVISGGAAADPAVLRGLRELGINAYQGYGLTECAPLVTLNRDQFYNDRSVGLVTPNTLLDVCDLQEDGTGEIRFRGDNVMLGYYKRPDATAGVIRDGWLYTGDLGYLDEQGFLYLTGRKKNVIVTAGGRNVFPEELESRLNGTPYIKESVVIGLYNAKRRDYDLVALIYPDVEKLTGELGGPPEAARLELEMRKAVTEVNSEVRSYKRLEGYVLRDAPFARNAARKIRRAGLAEQVKEYTRLRSHSESSHR